MVKNAIINGVDPIGLTVAYELLKQEGCHPIILEQRDFIVYKLWVLCLSQTMVPSHLNSKSFTPIFEPFLRDVLHSYLIRIF